MEISKTQEVNDTRYNHTETTRYVVHPTSGYVHQNVTSCDSYFIKECYNLAT